MRIQRPNPTHLNVYNNHIKNQQEQKEKINKEDRLQISDEAKRLHGDGETDEKRTAYVQSIKERVDAGKYEVNYEKIAQKMTEFWANNS